MSLLQSPESWRPPPHRSLSGPLLCAHPPHTVGAQQHHRAPSRNGNLWPRPRPTRLASAVPQEPPCPEACPLPCSAPPSSFPSLCYSYCPPLLPLCQRLPGWVLSGAIPAPELHLPRKSRAVKPGGTTAWLLRTCCRSKARCVQTPEPGASPQSFAQRSCQVDTVSPFHKWGNLVRGFPSSSDSTPGSRASLTSINSACTEMGNFDNASVTGEIEFAIRYCFKTCSLEICIKACKNLAYGEEKKKKCNPYVKTYLLPDRSSQGKRKTGVQKNTVDPTFQETLKYQVEPRQLATRRLQVSVWHLGTLARRVFLGEVTIPLATWDFKDSATQCFCWYPLRAQAEKLEDSFLPNNGELAVRAKLVFPTGPRKLQETQEGTDGPSPNGQLCLVVLGAKNLPVRSDGTLNSFVKGCLTLPDQQKLKLKSPVAKKQACPQWKHSFVFNGVSPSQLRQSSLELTVWDQAVFGVNDRLLGEARLSSEEDVAGEDSCSQSAHQWQKVLESPNLWTDMTLTLH
ncbi:synaptotagmin-like protein 3 isoform X5 [Lutra lutra]|uniref:synaptotagmin-like protein 3 isoform X5 n=1 Tax=Lutra lutra TaxID=9657 RepID=UPI001FD1068B|nr:synaptotagmin-like protein 3 isoform X5 [Lutra lutra]